MGAITKTVLLAMFIINYCQAAEYYVDVNHGVDSNSGTIDRPFQTISKAVDVISPGDIVFLREGVYRETISMDKSGTADAPITFKAYRSEHVTISGAIKVERWVGPDSQGIYVAPVAVPPDLPDQNHQVFVDGKMVHQAREPEIADHNDLFSQTWLAMVKGVAVYLQSANGQYLKAESRGGGAVLANADIPSTWEEFYLIDTNGGDLRSGDKVGFLTNDHVHHLLAENGGKANGGPSHVLSAVSKNFDSWEQFVIENVAPDNSIKSGDSVTLKASGGGYVGADPVDGECGGGSVHANIGSIGDCEKFTITIQPGSLVLFDEDSVDFDSANDAWAGSYVWGKFGAHWSLGMAKITGSAPGELMLGEKDEWWDSWGWSHGQGAIIGGLGALDTENEWRYQKYTSGMGGTLHFKPPAGSDPNRLIIEFKQRTWVVDVIGSHIVFSNIDFFAGQVSLKGNHNLLDNIRVAYGTHFVYRYTIGADNGFADGNNGVYIDGDDNIVRNSEIAYSAGSGMFLHGNRNEVRNCLIHDFGYMGTYTSGVFFDGSGSRLTHSTLFNSGRDVLHLGDIRKCIGCEITYNLLHDSTLLTDDSGVIYSFGHDLEGTEIAYNWIQGVTNSARKISSIHLGIYLDNGSRNALVHHNMITGLKNKPGVGPNTPHEGHLICNNTIIHNRAIDLDGNPISFDRIGDEAYCNCDFDANPGLQPNYYFEMIGECEHVRNTFGQVTSSKCTNPSDVYWKDPSKLKSFNTQYYASFNQARLDLINPQEVVTKDNGWEIVGHPDFRPKEGSSLVDAGSPCDGVADEVKGQAPDLGAYENNGANWIPGYAAVPRSVIDRGAPLGGIISLRSIANDRYVCADRNIDFDDAPLFANRDWVRTWERFYVEDAGGGSIALKALATDRYVAADFAQYRGKLVANRTVIGDWERFFWVINEDETTSLIAKKNGRYVVADDGGKQQLVPNREAIGKWEKFMVTEAPIGQIVSFQAIVNGRYVCADRNIDFDDAPLYANRDWMRNWEKFRVEDAGGGYIALKAFATNKYVSADFDKYGGKLVANRTAIGDWERFFWVVNDDKTVSLVAKKNEKYVVAEKSGEDQLVADRTAIGRWERFFVTGHEE